MNEPTLEQIKKFWEWCGFINKDDRLIKKGVIHLWEYPDGGNYKYELPSIDLNNLFKYAVPKLREMGSGFDLSTYVGGQYACAAYRGKAEFHEVIYDKDPTLALFWAIYKVMEV